MQINDSYQAQIKKVSDFKLKVLDSVENRNFNQNSLSEIIQDTFSPVRTEVKFDSNELKNISANGFFSKKGNDFHFVFSENMMKQIKNKNLAELEKGRKLNCFGNFFEVVTHEVKHGFYDVFCGHKRDNLDKHWWKAVPDKKVTELIDDKFEKLIDKCVNGEYYTSAQISGGIKRILNNFGLKDNQIATKVMFLTLLDDIKNENEAYLEGFKAKKEILGDKAKFYGMNFDEVLEDNSLMRKIPQKAYFDKFVPVKKIKRYF